MQALSLTSLRGVGLVIIVFASDAIGRGFAPGYY